ncbi:hypothetical protein KIPB_000267 [Kipferlia bialata]|uniref:Metallo-beta-lactamase domain-containing protein n=1 Tax=Kipferlia bialata TaxID=797122 RepID=A0A9K3GEU0_9EUKA|nr:hypothetical protein KIPB_000267 [Kipferlia bialata]|eukprot:g267.t1
MIYSSTASYSTNSAAAVQFGKRVVLFDAPEGIQHSLMHYKVSLGKISTIFVSHLHMDHVAGLVPLLTSMNTRALHTRVTVIGPKGIKELMDVYCRLTFSDFAPSLQVLEMEEGVSLTHPISESCTLTTHTLTHAVPSFAAVLRVKGRAAIDIERLKTAGFPIGPLCGDLIKLGRVTVNGREYIHSDYTQTNRDRKVVFCGDCCWDTAVPEHRAALVQDAMDCDLLIHEATFGRDMAARAPGMGHSTPSMAGCASKAMQARCMVMTHISNRYLQGLERDVPAEPTSEGGDNTKYSKYEPLFLSGKCFDAVFVTSDTVQHGCGIPGDSPLSQFIPDALEAGAQAVCLARAGLKVAFS